MSSPTDHAGVFSAPRKFDLSTVLVVTTAYAAVFSLLRAIGIPPVVVFIVATFFTSVALGQAILFGAEHPRLASAIVGSAFFVVALTIYALLDPGATPEELPSMIVWNLISGAFWGYVGGVVVGFVFMVAHWVRLMLSKRDSRPERQLP